MKELFLIITAYLIGSIPTALIISKHFFGVDIREYGSGNMGATNTFRVLGSKFGTIVMIGDMLKGILAVALYNLLPYYLTNELDRTNLMIGLGMAAVAGHIYPIWAQFRGASPNDGHVEINVRQTVFTPRRTGINYLTVSGFDLRVENRVR